MKQQKASVSIYESYTLIKPPACSGGLFCSNSFCLLLWVKQLRELTIASTHTYTQKLWMVRAETLSSCETMVWLRQTCAGTVFWNILLKGPCSADNAGSCPRVNSVCYKVPFSLWILSVEWRLEVVFLFQERSPSMISGIAKARLRLGCRNSAS